MKKEERDLYIDCLDGLAERTDLAETNDKFTPIQLKLFKELLDAEYIEGTNLANGHVTGIKINLKGRLFLGELREQKEKRKLFKNPYFLGIITGLILNLVTHITVKPFDVYFENQYGKPPQCDQDTPLDNPTKPKGLNQSSETTD